MRQRTVIEAEESEEVGAVIGVVGFAIGYLLGARAGQEGVARVIEAARTIARSDEVKGLVEGGTSMLNTAIRQGVGSLSGDSQPSGHEIGTRAA